MHCIGSLDRDSCGSFAPEHTVGVGKLESSLLDAELANEILPPVPISVEIFANSL